MYKYSDSLCLIRNSGYHWESVDLSSTPLHEAYAQYVQFYLTVIDELYEVKRYVDMDSYRRELNNSTLTVNEWLQEVGDDHLITVTHLPTEKLADVHYENAILQGFKINLARAGYSTQEGTSPERLPDLSMERTSVATDITLLHTHCLISVNGYYHRTDTDGIFTYVIDGGKTASKKRCSHVGITSFSSIGKITKYSLMDHDILPLNEGGQLKDGIIINLPEEFDGQSMIAIFGGYMLFPDKEAFYRNGERSWILYPKALPFVERYFESRDEIDLSSMRVDTPLDNKEHAILVQDLYSDASLRAWLKLSQSFIAFIDTPAIYFEKVNVRVSTLPGFVATYTEPKYPLIMGYGKAMEYSKTREVYNWALRIQDPFYKQFAFSQAPERIQAVMNDHFVPWKPYQRTQGYMLKIQGIKSGS